MKRFARPHVPEEELHAYADNQVSGGQRAEIAEHLMGCLICRAQYAEVRDLRIRASEILALAVPAVPAALQATEPAAAKSPRDASKKGRRSALMAAAVAVTVVGTWMVQQDDPKTAARAALANVFVAPALSASSAGPLSTSAPPNSGWHAVSWEDAVRFRNGDLAHLDGLPISAVRIERAPTGARPTVMVRHLLPDGRSAWLIDGSPTSLTAIAGIMAASGLSLSAPLPAEGGPGSPARLVVVAAELPDQAMADLRTKIALK